METGIVVAPPAGTTVYVRPIVALKEALEAYQLKKDIIDRVLVRDVDYGTIPGNPKPALFKPGAEKISNIFGMAPVFDDVEVVEDWTGKEHDGEPFFYYRQRCRLFLAGQPVGSADGSCNSWEKKYRYRWVQESDVPANLDKSRLPTRGGRISEFTFSVEKAETSGQYGKPADYWKKFQDAITGGTAIKITKKTKSGKIMDAWEIDSTLYQVPNTDIAEQVNTVLKMAQKRALVAAVLIVAGVSDYFTQDIEDYIDGVYTEAPAAKSASTGAAQAAAAEMGATVREMPEEPPVDLDNPFTEPPAGRPADGGAVKIMMAKIGKNQYPAVWARRFAAYKRANAFEVDGILQKLNLALTTDAEEAVQAVDGYLNAKDAEKAES